MRFATTLIILCVIPLLVCCVDIDRDRKLPTLGVTPIREDDCKERVVPPRMEGVCGPEERNRHCFVYNPVPSCICYMNGTCVNGEADRCSDCSNDEIFSIYDGKCKEATLAHAEDICQPFARDVRCFAYIPEVSCVCYFNGTCLTETIDKCSSCTNDDIVSVTTGCCTAETPIPIRPRPLPIKPLPPTRPLPPVKPLPIETPITPIPEDDCKERVVPPRMEGVCGPEERNRHCFVYNPVPSCICYMNGTCVNGEADRCSDCSNDEIFSIYDGKCKESILSHAEDICQPDARDVRCFAYIPEVSCVCYFNGTCLTETIDKCSSCTNDDIVSVTTGCCATTLEAIPIEPLPIKPFPIKPLPIEPIPIEDCRRTPLEKCPYLNPALVLCANHMTEGCICYNDGTCKEGLVNQCLNCMEDGVYAVEEGSKCPCPGVQTFQY